VGVATGEVIVGDLIEAEGASEFAALGQTPNLAARLQEQAAAQELVVSDTTHQIAGQLFESKALEQLNLKGFSTPVRAFRISAELSSLQERRRKTLEALMHLIEVQLIDKPMLLIAEDLHWVDPTTEMFLGRIVEIAKNSPINMLLTLARSADARLDA
jgi:hypothetical protein